MMPFPPEMLQNVQETLKQILAETNRQSDLIHHFDAWQAGRNNRWFVPRVVVVGSAGPGVRENQGPDSL